MRWHDGSLKTERYIYNLTKKGYEFEFACTYGQNCPDEIDVNNKTGWEIRRILKEYAEKNNIKDYVIYRNTSYHKDLHGNSVYEFYIKRLNK